MKYIVCNLKDHLNEFNIKDYIDTIKKITYKNVIFCVPNKYIKLFKNYKVCMQDYYDDIKEEYALIGHHSKKEEKEIVKDKLNKSLKNNIKVILCVGNDDINDYESIKQQLHYYLDNISENVIVAYEPYNMISSNNNVDIINIKEIISKIKKDFNVTILYGGNVNEKNINDIINVSDGVLIGRLSFNPHKLTKILIKNI